MRDQRQFGAGEISGGSPHARGFRTTNTHRINQHDLHAAVDHRARQISRRMAMRGYRERWRTARKTAARIRKVSTRVCDVGQLQPSAGIPQGVQHIGAQLRIKLQCKFNGRSQCVCRSVQPVDQRRDIRLRTCKHHPPNVTRHGANVVKPQRNRHGQTLPQGAPQPRVKRYTVSSADRIKTFSFLAPNRLAFRRRQIDRAIRLQQHIAGQWRMPFNHCRQGSIRAVALPLATSLPS